MIRLTSKTSSEICWVEGSSELLVLREGKTGLKTSPDPESIKIYSWWPQTRCHSLFFPMIWFSRTRIRVGTSEKRWEPGWRNKNSFLTEGIFLTAAHAGGQERRWGLSSYENTEVLGHCSWLDINYWLYVYHMHTVPTVARRGWWIPRSWNYRQLWTTICILGTEPGSSEKPVHALNPGVICSITPSLLSMTNFIPGEDDGASVCSARLQCVTLQ